MARLLTKKLDGLANVVLVRSSRQKSTRSPNSKTRDQIKTGPRVSHAAGDIKTSAQIIITGRFLRYRPALPLKLESTRSERKLSKSAEAEVEFQIIEGQTKRLLKRFVVSKQVSEGKSPLGFSRGSLDVRGSLFHKTYMGKVMNHLTDFVVPQVADYLDSRPLEGQVLAVESPEELLIINVGEKSGVEVRDEFVVYRVDPDYPDTLYREDVGDRFSKLGVVRVITVQEGFAEGVIMAGGDFSQGNLVRSKKSKPLPRAEKVKMTSAAAPISSQKTLRDSGPIRYPVQKVAKRRHTVSKFDFFSLFGWDLKL